MKKVLLNKDNRDHMQYLKHLQVNRYVQERRIVHKHIHVPPK